MPCGMAAKWLQVRYVCDGKSPGPSSPSLILSVETSTLGITALLPSHPLLSPLPSELLERWFSGKEDRFLAFPVKTWDSLLNQYHVPRNLKSSRMQLTLRVAWRLIFKRGGSTANWESAFALGTVHCYTQDIRDIKVWEPLRQKRDLCTLKSTVKKKIILSKQS